ncbi:Uncharacterized protein Rs2_39937 [Raphanus sativus]|nr:Uncharacterized protein Rs2_39937 [Raphanus sativus]
MYYVKISGVRPACERPCRRRSSLLFYCFAPLGSFFLELAAEALSELWFRPHLCRWSREWSNDASVGRFQWRGSGQLRQAVCSPGGGGFFRFTNAGSSFREEDLPQICLRRLWSSECGGY